MILVEVCQLVVEKNRGFHLIRDCEIDGAAGGVDNYSARVGNVDSSLAPRGRFGLDGVRGILVEMERYVFITHGSHIWVIWSVGEAF